MQFSTTPTTEGQPITEYCGVVTGEAILGANIFRDFFAAFGISSAGAPVPTRKNCVKRVTLRLRSWASRPKRWARMRWWALISTTKRSGRCQHADGERKRHGGENPSMKRSLSTLLLALLLAGCASEGALLIKARTNLIRAIRRRRPTRA